MDDQLLLHAERGLFERQALLHPQVSAAPRLLPAEPAADPPREHLREEVLHVREHVPDPSPLEAAAHAAVEGGVAELVVEAPFLLVREDLIGLVHLLELGLGGVVSGISIGMMLQRQLLVGPPKLVRGSFARYPQDFVETTLG